jgi:hypothetical protein
MRFASQKDFSKSNPLLVLSTQPAFLEKRSPAQTLIVSMVRLTIVSITIKSLRQYNLLDYMSHAITLLPFVCNGIVNLRIMKRFRVLQYYISIKTDAFVLVVSGALNSH